MVSPETGTLAGAITDGQLARVRELITAAGQTFEYRSFPQLGHNLHAQDPALYAETFRAWETPLPT